MLRAILAFNGAALLGCAIFFSVFDFYEIESSVITVLLLVLPFLDAGWRTQLFNTRALNAANSYALLVIASGYVVLLLIQSVNITAAISIIFLIALPEEWFFRYYFLHQLDTAGSKPWLNNITCSLLFVALHVASQGVNGLAVLFPSLFFGYIYQRTKSLLVVVLLHGLSNVFYIMYLQNSMSRWMYRLYIDGVGF